jgi:hypothetical protein
MASPPLKPENLVQDAGDGMYSPSADSVEIPNRGSWTESDISSASMLRLVFMGFRFRRSFRIIPGLRVNVRVRKSELWVSVRFRRSVHIIPGLRIRVGRTGLSASVGMRGARVAIGKRGISGSLGALGARLRELANLNTLKAWVILVPCAAFLVGFLLVGAAISHDRTRGNGLLIVPILLAVVTLIICVWLSRSGFGRKDAMKAASVLLQRAQPIVRAWFRGYERVKTASALLLHAQVHTAGPKVEIGPASEPSKMEASLEGAKPSKIPPSRESLPPQPPTLEQLNAMLNEKIRKYNQELEEAEERRKAEHERTARMHNLRHIMGKKTVMYYQDGEIQGPVTLLVLIDKAQKGIVPVDTQLCIEGTSVWKKLDEI